MQRFLIGRGVRACSLVVLAVAVAFASSAKAQDYVGAQRRYTSQDVLAIYGKAQTRPAPPALLFDAGVNASLRSSVHCGRLGLSFNLNSIARRVSQLPSQLAGQAQNLLYAMPMLTICYASPALCAELKNLNFQINERFKLLSDVCRSIDQTIASQSASEMGEAAAKKRGWQKCVNDNVAAGYDDDEAQEMCSNAPPQYLYTDMARGWLADATTTLEQNIISALMTNAGFMSDAMGNARYDFLASVLGELKLSANGKMLPVFPVYPADAKSVARRIQEMSVKLACDNNGRLRAAAFGVPAATPTSPGERSPLRSTATPGDVMFYEQALFDIVFDEMTTNDADDLDILDAPDKALACNALGRSLGRETTTKVATEGHATFALAVQNPQAPTDARQMYEGRAAAVFGAMIKEAEAPPERAVKNIRAVIHAMADKVRESRRNTAAEISKGMQDEQEEFKVTPCDSEETCEQ